LKFRAKASIRALHSSTEDSGHTIPAAQETIVDCEQENVTNNTNITVHVAEFYRWNGLQVYTMIVFGCRSREL